MCNEILVDTVLLLWHPASVLVEIANPEVLVSFLRRELGRRKPRGRPPGVPGPSTFDHDAALEMIAGGLSYAEVAEAAGCSRERIRQLDLKHNGKTAFDRRTDPYSAIDGELWLSTPRLPDKYKVSTLGRIWDTVKNVTLRPHPSHGVLIICIKGAIYYVRQLVMEAFVGPRPKGQRIITIDGNVQNARLDNLKYGVVLFFHHKNRKLTDDQVNAMLAKRAQKTSTNGSHRTGTTINALAKEYGVSYLTAWRLLDRGGYERKASN